MSPIVLQPISLSTSGTRLSQWFVYISIIGTTLTLVGCATGHGQVVSRLAPSEAMAPPPPPLALPPAQVQQQRYDEIDRRALAASENALAAENAAKLMPAPGAPTTNIYNGQSRW